MYDKSSYFCSYSLVTITFRQEYRNASQGFSTIVIVFITDSEINWELLKTIEHRTAVWSQFETPQQHVCIKSFRRNPKELQFF